MAGHGSPRPEDQAHHPNREVGRTTWVSRSGAKFGLYDGPGRTGMTIGRDALGGTTDITVGRPAGSWQPPGGGGGTSYNWENKGQS